MNESIQRAIECVDGASVLASALDVTAAAISEWLAERRPVPQVRCAMIELTTRGRVTCEQLRPDIDWVRVVDCRWPHPQGRPAVDVAADWHLIWPNLIGADGAPPVPAEVANG